MTALALIDTFHSFAQTAAPFLYIKDSQHYEETLELIENLLEEAEDSLEDPINSMIDMLSHSIEVYENRDEELIKFDELAMSGPADLATLRVLMEQHHLSMSDLPEIGSKSMVSRVLSGERELSKKHIQALSERFHINPGLFF
jgi:HTH-type transcriptional regulator/antitoxin HigA